MFELQTQPEHVSLGPSHGSKPTFPCRSCHTGSITAARCVKKTCSACSPSCHPGEMIHHPALATGGNAAKRKAATGTFLLIRTVSTFLIKGSLKIISFQYLHMLNRLQRSRHNEVKERTIKA